MLASAMRVVAVTSGGFGLAAMVVSNLAVFLALLLAATAMIEWTGGRLQLGRTPIREQLLLGCRVLGRVLVLLMVMSVVVSFAAGSLGIHMMIGFDGIAFDQHTALGVLWSATLAAIVLLMIVRVDGGGQLTLFGTLRELAHRANWMVPAILAVAGVHFVLQAIQGEVRWTVRTLFDSDAPDLMKRLTFLAFVVSFATMRLWATLAILTFALRKSYRQNSASNPGEALPPQI